MTFNPKRIGDNANRFLKDVPLVHYQDGFYLWQRTHFTEISPEEVSRLIIDRFSREKVRYLDTNSKKYRRKSYSPSGHWARELRTYLAGRNANAPPSWLQNETEYSAHEILPVRNGLLHIPSRTLLKHSRQFFALSTSRSSYASGQGNPLESAPAFASMLNRIWDDRDSVLLLQEILGYLLTPDPPGEEFQKFFLFRGAARGGKGTIVKIIEALVGPGDCTQVAPENLIKSSFALQPLIDHRIGMLGDLRLGEDKEIAKKLLPLLLKIVGGDTIPIDRKYKCHFHARLNTRLILESNTDLGVHDPTGALASRIVPLVFPRSFAGREDPGIPKAVLDEIDWILLWALDGWDRISARRNAGEFLFNLPQSSKLELKEIQKQGSIIQDFLATHCEQEIGVEASLEKTFALWAKWSIKQGVFPRDSVWLRQEIRAAWPRVTTRSGKPWGEKRQTFLCGMRLKKK